MKIFPETRRAHLMLYRRFFFLSLLYMSVCSIRQCYIFMTLFNSMTYFFSRASVSVF